jgi:hypothetical protein
MTLVLHDEMAGHFFGVLEGYLRYLDSDNDKT